MSRKRHSIHHLHFFILLILLTLGATATLVFSYQPQLQAAAVVITSLSYFLWGIIHHYKQDEIHREIILEYFFISLFGAILLISLILKN